MRERVNHREAVRSYLALLCGCWNSKEIERSSAQFSGTPLCVVEDGEWRWVVAMYRGKKYEKTERSSKESGGKGSGGGVGKGRRSENTGVVCRKGGACCTTGKESGG